jgi:hypothetical protein
VLLLDTNRGEEYHTVRPVSISWQGKRTKIPERKSFQGGINALCLSMSRDIRKLENPENTSEKVGLTQGRHAERVAKRVCP